MPFIYLACFNQHTQSTRWAGWHRQLRFVGASARVPLAESTAALIAQLKKNKNKRGWGIQSNDWPMKTDFSLGFFFSLLSQKEGASSLHLPSLSFTSWILLNTSVANCLCATVTWLVFISFHFPFLRLLSLHWLVWWEKGCSMLMQSGWLPGCASGQSPGKAALFSSPQGYRLTKEKD